MILTPNGGIFARVPTFVAQRKYQWSSSKCGDNQCVHFFADISARTWPSSRCSGSSTRTCPMFCGLNFACWTTWPLRRWTNIWVCPLSTAAHSFSSQSRSRTLAATSSTPSSTMASWLTYSSSTQTRPTHWRSQKGRPYNWTLIKSSPTLVYTASSSASWLRNLTDISQLSHRYLINISQISHRNPTISGSHKFCSVIFLREKAP